jgi:LmbE family N-acetylglucosaminyl deacetylase
MDKMFENSVLVVAHPDDEILWFSSICEKVNHVSFCFLGNESHPHWESARSKTISQMPFKSISCLKLLESGSYNNADWNNPVTTNYGIAVSKRKKSYYKYYKNYYEIKENLRKILARYHNVFTHNPWGEYGNEEHVQVYRAIKNLQKENEFNLWFSNYCSNNSVQLMLRYISQLHFENVTKRTNKELAKNIMELYKKNDCWTWYDHWEWFNEESFMKDEIEKEITEGCGRIFPLNMIKMKQSTSSNRANLFLRKLAARISGLKNRADISSRDL